MALVVRVSAVYCVRICGIVCDCILFLLPVCGIEVQVTSGDDPRDDSSPYLFAEAEEEQSRHELEARQKIEERKQEAEE